ncbi:MAG TPA: hypothetical protein VFY60_08660 [Pyrinomonadaceae bacterium]|nr:hypothetical protein [Pyrinomonadaceae bacterium]
MSSQNIQSLWSPDIKATVLSPLTILKGQAEALALQTGGILLAEVIEEREEGSVLLFLDLVAPALNGSRHRILKVTHNEDMPYPARLEAEVFRTLINSSTSAFTDEGFTDNVAKVLKSPHVLAIAQSLLARANEAITAAAPAR